MVADTIQNDTVLGFGLKYWLQVSREFVYGVAVVFYLLRHRFIIAIVLVTGDEDLKSTGLSQNHD